MALLKLFNKVDKETNHFTSCDLGEGCVYCGKKSGVVIMFCRLCGTQRCWTECSDKFEYRECPKCEITGREGKDKYWLCNDLCWMELDETTERHGNSARFWTTWGLDIARKPRDPRPYLANAMSKLHRGGELGDPLAFLVMAMIYYTWGKIPGSDDTDSEDIAKEIYGRIKHLFPDNPDLFFFKTTGDPHKLYGT